MLTGVKSNTEIRANARERLKGNWGKSVLTVVIYFILTNVIESVISNDIFGWILGIMLLLIIGSWSAGILTYFIHLVRKEASSIKLLFSQLPRLIPFFILFLLQSLFILLWSLLLIVPGIIASLRYTLAFYILIDHPEMSASQAINRSKEMMLGQKWKYFKLFFFFIGWYLLCILSLGIGFLWLIPYIYATHASFYEDLRLKYEERISFSKDQML
jgi:uncharacterized membrane protein